MLIVLSFSIASQLRHLPSNPPQILIKTTENSKDVKLLAFTIKPMAQPVLGSTPHCSLTQIAALLQASVVRISRFTQKTNHISQV